MTHCAWCEEPRTSVVENLVSKRTQPYHWSQIDQLCEAIHPTQKDLAEAKRIVFVGGSGRCGTTLTKNVLGLHPQIFRIDQETNPWPGRIRRWARLQLSRAIAGRDEKHADWILEKTPANALWADELIEEFEKANVDVRYIHVFRDVERTVDSIMKLGALPAPGFGRVQTREVAKSYVEFMNWVGAERALQHPKRVLGINFDTLVLHPDKELGRVCEWLGIKAPVKAMVQYPYRRDRAA
jgi:hypothetical protein